MPKLGQFKYKNPEELNGAINAYFLNCEANAKVPTKGGLANALDITRETLVRYERTDTFSELLKKTNERIADYWIQAARSGRGINPVFAMFYLKAQHDWEDRQSISVAGSFSLHDLLVKARRIGSRGGKGGGPSGGAGD